jgi:hypothetical protein
MKDKMQSPPAPMTARMLLVRAFGEEGEQHALHSVEKWIKGLTGSLQIFCTCGDLVGVPDTPENRLSLKNMWKGR